MRNISRILLMLTLLALSAACQTTQTTATMPGREVCRIWGSVTYSGKGDTKLTIDQIRALNAKRSAYCEGKP